MNRRTWIKSVAAVTATSSATIVRAGAGSGPDDVVPLWSSDKSDTQAITVPPLLTERIVERSTDASVLDRAIHGVAVPRINVFRPAQPNGSWIVIAPGGGYRWVVIDREGFEMARWFAARGITAFVLYYRLPADGWANAPQVATQDVGQAMKVIQARASEWRIDPAKSAVMGFSAGGHVVASHIAGAASEARSHPQLAALIYPVISMHEPHAHSGSRLQLLGTRPSVAQLNAHSPHLHAHAASPPTFLLHARDDRAVPADNSLLMRDALERVGVETELHLFAKGGHGFGLRNARGKPVDIWPTLWLRWAATHGWGE
jgi:acetyl esterase/lipase